MPDLPLPEWRRQPRLDALCGRARRDGGARRGGVSRWRGGARLATGTSPVYTAGTSARAGRPARSALSRRRGGRGGQYTYHGPGQRVGYLVLDLNRRGRDVRCFVHGVEGWVIAALARLGVEAFRAPGRVGIWTFDRGREAKIGAIGVRVRRWVTLHGFAINNTPDLSHSGGIVPCGLPDHPVTSLAALGRNVAPAALDAALANTFHSFLDSLSCTREMEA